MARHRDLDIKVRVVYVGIFVLRCLTEELARAIDKWVQILVIRVMLFKTAVPLKPTE